MTTPVLVAGSANLDFVVRAPRIPEPGETVLGEGFTTHPGGKGANQAVAAARAGGVGTRLLAAFGEDPYAAPIEASLREAGVQVLARRVRGVATGTAFITVAANGENAITVAPGANACLSAADLPPLAGTSHLLMQLESPLESVLGWAQAARAAGVTVVLNAAPARALPPALLALLDVLVVNEGELAQVAGGAAAAATLEERMARVNVPALVVTLGARGCVARTPAGRLVLPAFTVPVLDTTAAGDTFCGVLVAALARQLPWPAALREASAAAALACTRAGAQDSIPARADVLRWLEPSA